MDQLALDAELALVFLGDTATNAIPAHQAIAAGQTNKTDPPEARFRAKIVLKIIQEK